MKTLLQAIAIVATLTICLFAGYMIGESCSIKGISAPSNTINLDTLEQRVFEQYGAGDAGCEEMLYLTTGVHQDFMGNPDSSVSRAFNYDYQICLNDSFTVVYDVYGKFVTTVPYVKGSAWDEAMSWENL